LHKNSHYNEPLCAKPGAASSFTLETVMSADCACGDSLRQWAAKINVTPSTWRSSDQDGRPERRAGARDLSYAVQEIKLFEMNT
jgi:hypothetical protein